eukprot:m.92889 g.92889  ORF g.92889 m.92889 type:complete len:676 (-) comp14966_c0_seq1:114-2141(-)
MALKIALCLQLVALAVGTATMRRLVYQSLKGNSGMNTCTRLLNATHQIGCTSPESGAVGILFNIAEESHLDTFKDASEDAYIALVEARMLTPANYKRLLAMKHYKGALVYQEGAFPSSQSPDNFVPNQDNGLPFGDSPTIWNSNGGGFGVPDRTADGSVGMHFLNHGDRPLYLLSEEDRVTVFAQYNRYNSKLLDGSSDYPLFGAQLFNFMYGVRDAHLCLRREHCDPVSGQNVWGSTRLVKKDEGLVLAAAQMDALALFHDVAAGANADASGMVTLISAARILSRSDNRATLDSLQRTIAFMLFNGEALGYIGSSKLGYDLFNGDTWPSSEQALSFDNLEGYLELSQLTGDGNLYAYANSAAAASDIVSELTIAKTLAPNVAALVDETASELPPVSLRGLLNEQRDSAKQDAFPGVVLTGYPNSGFSNKYYNSRFDNGDNVNASSDETMDKLCDTALLVARTLAGIANDTDVADITLNTDASECQHLKDMLVCFASNQTCSLAQQSTGLQGSIPNTPMSRYVGVTRSATTFQRGAFFAFQLMAEALSIENVTLVDDTCAPNNDIKQYQTVQWRNGPCYNTTAYVSRAISPAFASYYKLKGVGTAEANYADGRDPRWSTWTESVWGATSGRTFVMADPRLQLATLLGGIAYFFACIGGVYACTQCTSQGVAGTLA